VYINIIDIHESTDTDEDTDYNRQFLQLDQFSVMQKTDCRKTVNYLLRLYCKNN